MGFRKQRKASTTAQNDEAVVMHQHLSSNLRIDVSAMSGHDSIESQGTLPSVCRQLKKQLILLAAAGRQKSFVFGQYLTHECKQSVRLGRFGLHVLVRQHRKREIPDLGLGLAPKTFMLRN